MLKIGKNKKEIEIKDFDSLRLCKYKSARLDVHISASIKNGCLLISGHDLGAVVEEFYDDSDYEYWYSFDIENTKLLITRLSEQKPELNVKELLLDIFRGESGCSNLSDFCEKFGIKYNFSSYA